MEYVDIEHRARPSKSDAAELAWLLKNGVDLGPAEQDTLLNYFAPRPKRFKSVNQWLAAACIQTKNGGRDFHRRIHVVDGVVYATDGSRMHYGLSSWDTGQYSPVDFSKMASQINTPPFAQVIPDSTKMKSAMLGDIRLKVSAKNGRFCYIKNGPSVQEHYFLEATVGCSNVTAVFYDDSQMMGKCMYGSWLISAYRT